MSSTVSRIQRLRAAAVDGRCRNVRYRQKQLESLHQGLAEKASSMCAAVTKDNQGGSSSIEVEAEFCMAMDAVRYFHESLDFEGDLKREYSVAAGKDNPTRRVGMGLVIIRPTTHTRIFSIMSSIAAALAAGNCIILELRGTLLEVDSVLKELLPAALDQDTFLISTAKVDSREVGPHTLVDQQYKETSDSSTRDILSSSTARVIAVVDRSADVDAAARAIVNARFGFQGSSPYAPDLVIVNEFVKKPFIEACVRYTSKRFAGGSEKSGSSRRGGQEILKEIQDAERKGDLSSFGSSSFMLFDISNRDSNLTRTKFTDRFLAITSCTSISDAIHSQRDEATFLAGYFFGTPEVGNFLSQNIDCHIVYINQIPSHLQFGPAASIAHPPSIPHRYSIEMFSKPRPQFIEALSASLSTISTLIEDSDRAALRQLRSLAVVPIKVQKQPPGKAIGFFEQGILTGVSITLSVAVPALGYGFYIVGRKALGWALRSR